MPVAHPIGSCSRAELDILERSTQLSMFGTLQKKLGPTPVAGPPRWTSRLEKPPDQQSRCDIKKRWSESALIDFSEEAGCLKIERKHSSPKIHPCVCVVEGLNIGLKT